jgi:predicted RNA-binding protein YlqC (UPF0109 family)
VTKQQELVEALVKELQESPDLESVSITISRTPDKSDGVEVRTDARRVDPMDWRWRESDWFK